MPRFASELPGYVAGAIKRFSGRRDQRPYDAAAFQVAPVSPVCIFDAADYAADFARIVGDGLNELRIPVEQRRVLLKPNLVEYEAGSVINTNPLLIAGAAAAFLRAGARDVIVGEGPGHRRDIDYLLGAAGLDDYLADLRVPFVDLNHDDVAVVPLRSHFSTWDQIALPQTLLAADLIVSMPKLKTHHWAGMTASMKNLFGVVPGAVPPTNAPLAAEKRVCHSGAR